ncbi:uracil-DNA glycosylase-like protein [Cerioporus squamosus]|nr:uracil-DNA glycosylase-like protein [Cerioporus squamosus]
MSDPVVKDEPVGTNGTITPTQKLREKLSAFRFNDESVPSLRRSRRGQACAGRYAKFEEVDTELPTLPPVGPSPKKRSRSRIVDRHVKSEDSGAAPKKARVSRSSSPKKRQVAPPEKYAHLDSLSDHLGEGSDMLDVLFCGINPGQMSATVGHHFAHPTNHFWRCLHGAGLTDRLLSASEDGTLPEHFNLGMAAELANSEFTAGAPALMRKILEKRPRIVCFVGKAIWELFVRAVAPPSQSPRTLSEAPGSPSGRTSQVSPDGILAQSSDQLQSPTKQRPSAKKAKSGALPVVYDLQPYKVVHDTPDAVVRETLFFVVVSTSGLVAGYQLPEKIKQFTRLKQRLDELKNGSLDTSAMVVIPSVMS